MEFKRAFFLIILISMILGALAYFNHPAKPELPAELRPKTKAVSPLEEQILPPLAPLPAR